MTVIDTIYGLTNTSENETKEVVLKSQDQRINLKPKAL